MYTRKFAMLPRPDAARKCAVQKVMNELVASYLIYLCTDSAVVPLCRADARISEPECPIGKCAPRGRPFPIVLCAGAQ